MNRLKEKYFRQVQTKLGEEFGIKNKLAIPRLKKIVISIGVGEAKDNEGILEKVRSYLTSIAGQKAVVTLSKKSIAAFKVSKGQSVGMMVTLRGEKMYSFLDKLINIVLPKVRDFKGISTESFDSLGNLNLGLKEQTIFPEVDYKLIDKVRGMAVTIVISSGGKEQAKRLLELFGMPFKK